MDSESTIIDRCEPDHFYCEHEPCGAAAVWRRDPQLDLTEEMMTQLKAVNFACDEHKDELK